MKKYFKKISALLMAAIMVLSMCTAVFATSTPGADGIYGTEDDRGSVTVAGVEEEKGVTVSVYPIMLAEYKNNTFSGYTNPYNLTIEDVDNVPTVKVTADKLTGIYDTVKGNEGWITLDKNGTVWHKDGLKVGTYLVKVSGSESVSYNLAVVSIQYKENNALEEKGVNMIEDGKTWVKRSGAPSVDKKVNGTKGNTVNIGDTVNYEVRINSIPQYTGSHPVLNIEDTLSDGLTLDTKSIVVKVVKKDGTEVTLSEDEKQYKIDTTTDQKLKVDFVVDGKYTLNDYEGGTVVITYSATLNEDAKVNETDNNNDVVLKYSKDSKENNELGEDKDKTYTYTFDIDGHVDGQISTEDIIKKVETVKGGTETKALAGAEFTLYKKFENGECKDKYENDVTKKEGTSTPNPAVSDDNGQLHFTGLAAGTYYLKETKAPKGYSLNTNVFKVVIDAQIDSTSGKLESWTITMYELEKTKDGYTEKKLGDNTFSVTNEGKATLNAEKINSTEIMNTKLTQLPSTGGMGTYIFTIAGVVLMACAAGAFIISRKKSSEE